MASERVVVGQGRLRRLKWIARLEGATLVALVCVAVPLKYWAQEPSFVSFLGPIPGLVFVLYLIVLAEAAAGARLSVGEVFRLLVVGVAPFGALLNDRWLSDWIERRAPPGAAQRRDAVSGRVGAQRRGR